MATMSLFIVCFLTEVSLGISIFHFHSKDYKIVNEIDSDRPSHLIFINSMKNPVSFSRPEIHNVSSQNMMGYVFSSRPYAAKSKMSVLSGFSPTNISVSSSSKRQRRSVTILPIQHQRRLALRTDTGEKRFQTFTNRERQILARGHFQRSRGGISRNIRQRVSDFPINHRIPISEIPVLNPEPERFRPFPELRIVLPESNLRTNGMKSDPEQSRVWNIFSPNTRPEINPEPGSRGMRLNPGLGIAKPNLEPGRIKPNPELGIFRPNPEPGRRIIETGGIVPESNHRLPNQLIPSGSFKFPSEETGDRFSNGHQFSLKKHIQVELPQTDWSGPIPWPRQERRHDLQKIHYPLFPWWQKRTRIPSKRSDHLSNVGNTDNQTDTEDAFNVSIREESNRGDIGVPDSCVALTANGDCNFYRCFDQRHTCPVEQNFAYNVAFYLCKRTENYLNFFDDQARKYLRGVKRCQMEALVPIYKTEVPTCSQIEAVGLDILTGGILPPSINDISCFFQNTSFCDIMEDPQNVQLMYDLYGGNGYTEYRVFIHFVKLIQKCSHVALESFNQRYAKRFMTFQD